MKSSQEQLSSRGYLPKEMILNDSIEIEVLFNQLNNSDPVQRSMAARVLGKYYILQKETAKKLLERLCIEKKLYTRIEICDALAKGDSGTVSAMIPYITYLGNNQYRSIEEAKTSKKKSYPLPRGLITRTIGRMEASVASTLLKNLSQEEYAPEILEGVGYLIFNHPKLQTVENYEEARDYYEQYKNNLLFVWKFVIFSSVFPYSYVEETLSDIALEFPQEAIQRELERTLVICKNH